MDIISGTTKAHSLINKFLPDWKMKLNTRAKRIAGKCIYHLKTIELSEAHILHCDWEDVKDTVLHEIAHALTPSDKGHGKEWKEMAKKLGANPERASDGDILPPGKYVLQCPNCKITVTYHRPVKTSFSACKSCCNKYNMGRWTPKYVLQKIVDNNTKKE